MTKSRLVPLVVLLGACLGAHLMWRGGASRTPDAKPDTTAADTIEAAGWAAAHDDRTLIVDYRDDVTDADLAATPEIEEPISRWSGAAAPEDGAAVQPLVGRRPPLPGALRLCRRGCRGRPTPERRSAGRIGELGRR